MARRNEICNTPMIIDQVIGFAVLIVTLATGRYAAVTFMALMAVTLTASYPEKHRQN